MQIATKNATESQLEMYQSVYFFVIVQVNETFSAGGVNPIIKKFTTVFLIAPLDISH